MCCKTHRDSSLAFGVGEGFDEGGELEDFDLRRTVEPVHRAKTARWRRDVAPESLFQLSCAITFTHNVENQTKGRNDRRDGDIKSPRREALTRGEGSHVIQAGAETIVTLPLRPFSFTPDLPHTIFTFPPGPRKRGGVQCGVNQKTAN